MRNAGYSAEVGGAILSAGGIGAILSPPTLGAAAFLIAEFLQISYLQVLVMAIVPTLLYYLSIFLMIEADSRRLGTRHVGVSSLSLAQLTWRYGYHFSSLVAIAGFMVLGMTAFRAVFWAICLAVALSFVRPETALWPGKLVRALEAGGKGVLSVAATTATAGIIVGVVTLTGLGLKIAGIIVTLAGGSLFLTVAYSAAAVLVLGLAVPVTASYIIAAVMIAPALVQVGVAPAAAHMLIFYYAVLSEVSPPTALSPLAAAALTGGDPFRTMMVTWKYTLPAFLVPFVFTLRGEGMGILLQGPIGQIAWTSMTAAIGVCALAVGAGGWLRRQATLLERLLAVAAGLLMMYPATTTDFAGLAGFALMIALHFWRTRGSALEPEARSLKPKAQLTLPQPEVDGDRHHDRYRGAVQQRRRVLPLPDSFECRGIQQGNRSKHPRVVNPPVGANRRRDDHHALHASGTGNRRIYGSRVVDLRGRPDIAANRHRGPRRVGCWRWWSRWSGVVAARYESNAVLQSRQIGSLVRTIGLSGAIPCGASTRTAGFTTDGASLDATLGGGGDGGNGG